MQLSLYKDQIKSIYFSNPCEHRLNILFQNKQIDQFITQVQQLCSQGNDVSEQAKMYCKIFEEIIHKIGDVNTKLCESKQGWITSKLDHQSEYAFKVKGTNLQLRYQGLIEANMENLCIMIYQAGLYDKWVPFCNHSVQIEQLSPLEKIMLLTFKIPFLSERFGFFHGLGIDRSHKNGTIVIYGEGITQKPQMLERYKIDPKADKLSKMVVLDLKYCICEISCESNNLYKVRCYSEINSKMPYIPQWLVSAILKRMGGFVFHKVLKQSQQLEGSFWEKKAAEEKDDPFYPWIKKRLQIWHENAGSSLSKRQQRGKM